MSLLFSVFWILFFAWLGSERNFKSFYSHLLKARDGFSFAGVKSLVL